MPTILPEYRLFFTETHRLLNLTLSIGGLGPSHQKLVAEIVLLRLFYLFENLVTLVPAKLACGANYIDGSAASCLIRARSIDAAASLFRTHSRPKPHRYLKWSTASEIKKNVRHVLAITDNYIKVIDRSGNHIDEIRRVRNRIAHNNRKARSDFRFIVRRYYGAELNHITPGILLLSPRQAPNLLEQYIRKTLIVAKDIVKA